MKLQTAFVLLFITALVDHGLAWSWQVPERNFLHPSGMPNSVLIEGLARANTEDTAKLGYLIVTKLQELMAAASHKDVLSNVRNPACVSHLAHIFHQLDLWINKGTLPDTFILQLIDSWGKLPSGIFSGHLTEPGDFQECINAEGYLNTSFAPGYAKGTYSLGLVGFSPQAVGRDTLPGRAPNKTNGGAVAPDELLEHMLADSGCFMSLLPLIGTCFPDTCSQEDAQQFVNNLMMATFGDQVYFWLFPQVGAEKEALNAGATVMICALVVLLNICLLGTALDIGIVATGKQVKDKGWVAVLRSFSVYSNTIELLGSRGQEPWLRCLDGLEFLSFAWVLAANSWGVLSYQTTWNAIDLRESVRSGWAMMLILNASVAFDSLFLINGTRASVLLLRELDHKKKLPVLPLFLWQYLRITLPVLIVAGFGATLLSYVANGPLWFIIEAEAKSCQSNWWHNILHITTIMNYDIANPDQYMCHSNSWHVADTMIYFILAPIFVYVLWRWKKIGLGLVILWIAQVIIQTGITIDAKHLMPTYIMSLPGPTINAYFYNLYKQPWMRSSPYAVGILLGYLLHCCWNRQNIFSRLLPRWTVLTGWIMSTGIALAVIFCPTNLFDVANADDAQGSIAAILYGSLHRFAWSVALAWVIFACVNGYAEWINKFLSWQPFVSGGRVGLCMYLSGEYIQRVHKLSNYHPVRYDVFNFAEGYVFQMVLSLIVGCILYVTVEAPVLRLERVISGKPLCNNVDENFGDKS